MEKKKDIKQIISKIKLKKKANLKCVIPPFFLDESGETPPQNPDVQLRKIRLEELPVNFKYKKCKVSFFFSRIF